MWGWIKGDFDFLTEVLYLTLVKTYVSHLVFSPTFSTNTFGLRKGKTEDKADILRGLLATHLRHRKVRQLPVLHFCQCDPLNYLKAICSMEV